MKKFLIVACALTILGGASFAQTATTTTKKVETKKEVKHVKKHHPKKHHAVVKTVKTEKTTTKK